MQAAMKSAKSSGGTFYNHCGMSRGDMNSSIVGNGVQLLVQFGTVKSHDRVNGGLMTLFFSVGARGGQTWHVLSGGQMSE